MKLFFTTAATLLLFSVTHASLGSPRLHAPSFVRTQGLGPIEPLMAAKLYGGLQLVQGVVQTLSPSTYCDIYGIRGDDGVKGNTKLIRQQGLQSLQQGILAYLLVFQDSMDLSVTQAGGIAALTVVADRLGSLLNNESKTIGPRKVVDCAVLASAGATAVAGLSGLGWAMTALKVMGAGQVVCCGIPLVAMPGKMCGKVLQWKQSNAVTNSLARGLGWATASTGALVAGLAWGLSATTALGASMVVTAVSALKYLISDDDALGMDNATVTAWALIPAVLAAAVFWEGE